MLLKNTDRRENATFNCGFTYVVPRGKAVDIPERVAKKMMLRWPKLVPADQVNAESEMAELESELAGQEFEAAEADETEA